MIYVIHTCSYVGLGVSRVILLVVLACIGSIKFCSWNSEWDRNDWTWAPTTCTELVIIYWIIQ